MKKRWYIYILIIITISIPKFTYAENTLSIENTNSIDTQNAYKNEISTESIIKEQESKFGIKDFLKETEKYVPEYFKYLKKQQQEKLIMKVFGTKYYQCLAKKLQTH